MAVILLVGFVCIVAASGIAVDKAPVDVDDVDNSVPSVVGEIDPRLDKNSDQYDIDYVGLCAYGEDFLNYSDEVKAQLIELAEVELAEGMTSCHWREYEAITSGVRQTRRITYDEAVAIINEYDEFQDIIDQMTLIHGVIDVEKGSGFTYYEFWLDDEGNEKISTVLQQIYYVNTVSCESIQLR